MKTNSLHKNVREERELKNSRLKAKDSRKSRNKRLILISIVLLGFLAIFSSSCSSKENKSQEPKVATKTYLYIDKNGEKNIIFSRVEPKGVILDNRLSLNENLLVINSREDEISLTQPLEFQEYEGLKRTYTVMTYTAQYNTLFNKVYIVNTKTEPTSSFAWELLAMFLILVVYGFLIHRTSLDPRENQIDYHDESLSWRFSSFFFKMCLVILFVIVFNNNVYDDSVDHLVYLLSILAGFVFFSFISGLFFDKESRNRNFLSIVTILGSVYLLTAGYYHWGLVVLSFFVGILIAQIIYSVEQWKLRKLDPVDRELKMVRKSRKF